MSAVKVESSEIINQGGLKRQLKVIVAEAVVTDRLAKETRTLAKKMRVPGFRKGKMPSQSVTRKYGAQLKEQVIGEVVQSVFEEAVKTHELQLVSRPDLTILSDKPKQDLSFTVDFEIYPDIELVDLTSLKLTQPVVSIEADNIAQSIEKLQDENKLWDAVTRKAKAGDQCLIDFKGTLDGEPFPGGTAEGQKIILGEGQMLADFEQGILGHTVGETVQFPLTFPEDYHADLAGKTVEFSVTLHQVAEGKRPDIDEAFIKQMGVESGKQEDLEQEVTQTLTASVKKQLDEIKYLRAGEMLAKKCKLQLPESLLDEEKKQALAALNQAEKTSLTEADLSRQQRKKIDKQAQFKLTTSLLLQAVIKEYEISIDEQAFRTYVSSLSLPYIDESAFINWFFSDKARVENAKVKVLEQQAVEKVFELAQTKDKSVSYDDVEKLLNKEIASHE